MEQTLARKFGQKYFWRKLPDGSVFEAVCGVKGTVLHYQGNIGLALDEAFAKGLPIARFILKSRQEILKACGCSKEAAAALLMDIVQRRIDGRSDDSPGRPRGKRRKGLARMRMQSRFQP